MYLTAVQRRMLTEVYEGRTEFGGRLLRTARKLERDGVLRVVSVEGRINRMTGSTDKIVTVELT